MYDCLVTPAFCLILAGIGFPNLAQALLATLSTIVCTCFESTPFTSVFSVLENVVFLSPGCFIFSDS
jgi:hypothetical protein